jgi:hypothetical protein
VRLQRAGELVNEFIDLALPPWNCSRRELDATWISAFGNAVVLSRFRNRERAEDFWQLQKAICFFFGQGPRHVSL